MPIENVIRRYTIPLYAAEDGTGKETPGDDTGGGDAGNGDGKGDDKSAKAPAPVLGADAAGEGAGDDKAPKDDKASKDGGGEGAPVDDKTPKDDKGDDKGDKTDDAVPEGEYEFAMPEGVELDKGMANAMTPLFKELGITQGQANKLVEAYGAQVQTSAEAAAQAFVDTVVGWDTAAKADPEIGNDHWDATVAAGNAALQKLGTPELTKALADTGMSNHPEMIRFMARTAKAIGVDTFDKGDTVDTGDVSTEVSWYADTTPAIKKG